MIRHRPHGSGHPYATSIDQRVPTRPLVGRPIELRVAAARSVSSVLCEWDDGNSVRSFPLASCAEGAAAAVPGAEGHLATAAAGGTSASVCWAATSPPVMDGGSVRYRFLATAEDARRRTRWFEVTAADWVHVGGTLRSDGLSRIVPDSVSWLADAAGTHRVRFALRLDPAEHVIGFGERFDRLDQRGHHLDATVFEQYKGQGAAGRTYLPMPFAHVLGGAGWAFHVDTSRRTWFDVDTTQTDRLWVEADLGGRAEEDLTVRFYNGTVGQVLQAWLERVGNPVELPPWVFGLWASGNEWNTQQRILSEIGRHHEEDIPVAAVVIEAWSDESTFTAFRDASYDVHPDGAPHQLSDFEFRADGAWPDPKALVDSLHDQDVRVLLWQIPLAKMRPHPSGQAKADAQTMIEKQYCVTELDGRPYRNRGWWFPLALIPDLTNPEAREWWLAKRRYLVEDVGIDGFKTDGGEHAWGEDLRYADGRTGIAGNNLFPVRYAEAYGELLTSCGKPPVTFSRAGFTGSQAHGTFWAGDEDSSWTAMRSSLLAGLTASACGIVYWGWDLAGFSGPIPDVELYLRAAGVSTFLPIMQYHSEFNHHRTPSRDRTPWNIAEQTGDPRVLPTFRRFSQLRQRLRPYLAEQARRTIQTGWPLLRALCLTRPDDPAAWAHPLQYQLGDDLLVAPIVEPGAQTTTAYLPPGRWVNVWTAAIVTGDREITERSSLDEVPVWCRAQAWSGLRDVFTGS
jgi:alpha-glucosidase (family GH31 glycosyl hydrolase)